ncbi:MAG: FecR domain-containing protein [candidate division Zixibacteria bacterium]|nr:FecR domain-containing protein [candidate division Zixibacteria bacterium]
MTVVFRKTPVRTKTLMSVIILCICTIMALGDLLSASINNDKGAFTFVDGQARKQKTGDEEWQAAEVNTPVAGGDRVKTLIRTRAEIQLAELDIIRLAPKTTIDVVKLYKEGKDKKRESQIEVEEGDIWANIGSLDANSALDLNTAVANATVKGTVFRVNVGEDNSTELKVYRGQVDIEGSTPVGDEKPTQDEKKSGSLSPKKTGAPKQVSGPKEVSMKEWTYIVREMQKIVISANSKVMYHGSFSNDDRDEKTDWIKWNKWRDQQSGLKSATDEIIPEEPIPEPPDTTKKRENQGD